MASDVVQSVAAAEAARSRGGFPRVAVIGGGIAGLVAAWELARSGAEVQLFERADRLGGRVCAGQLGGVHFDLGPESYATRGGEVERLLADLGLAGRITATSGGRSWVVSKGRAAPLPPAGAIGIPARPWGAEARRVIGVQGALRCTIEPWLPRSIGKRESSLGGVVRARLGRRTLDRLVAPVVRGIYSANPSALPISAVPGLAQTYVERGSLRAAAQKQRGSARASGAAVAGVRGGVHSVVAYLEQELERLGARIYRETEVAAVRAPKGALFEPDGDSVDAAPHQFTRGFEVVVDGGRVHAVDAVLVTVPGILPVITSDRGHAAEPSKRAASSSDEFVMSDEVSNAEARKGERVGGTTAGPADSSTWVEVIAILVEDERLNAAPRGTGALVAEDARHATPPIAAKALTHANIKWAWLAEQLPMNTHLLRLSYGEHGADAVTLQMPDPAVERLALADAGAILGIDLPEAALKGMARQTHEIPRAGSRPSATPQRAADEPIGAAEQGLGPSLPRGIFATGEWVAGTGFAAVIPSARASARALLATVAPAQPSHP
ncbi:FAD-dependent oxidoreductase [Leucobacter viscericola]|uniref:FAD-dependent oxidoreductase n=1 Tax=Leucobacter viscericola TaxID=2714935 RepID=A0A6G7XFT5_9MICO|nr:FAD-dependent oxidoreductase [Leucobacter viscericola]QIK63413.1 FAD-dependent oxidoreductase [Leucobacter viscericola]